MTNIKWVAVFFIVIVCLSLKGWSQSKFVSTNEKVSIVPYNFYKHFNDNINDPDGTIKIKHNYLSIPNTGDAQYICYSDSTNKLINKIKLDFSGPDVAWDFYFSKDLENTIVVVSKIEEIGISGYLIYILTKSHMYYLGEYKNKLNFNEKAELKNILTIYEKNNNIFCRFTKKGAVDLQKYSRPKTNSAQSKNNIQTSVLEYYKSNIKDFKIDGDPGSFIDSSECQIVVGDINNDGKQDAIIRYGFSSGASSNPVYYILKILLNNSDGTFKIINTNIGYCAEPQSIENNIIHIYKLESCMFPTPIIEHFYKFVKSKLIQLKADKITIEK